jgi:hypothetical protein
MPVPSVAEWEWLNWKFPRPVRAGETVYARWTLTQKRPPVGGAPTAIVVWRVDVHTADGALCAEGEVGASVRRKSQAPRPRADEGAAAAAPAAPRRRRGRRPAAGAPAPEAPPPPVEAPAAAPVEKAGSSRRRRRRRPRTGTPAGPDGQPAASAPSPTAVPSPQTPGPATATVPPAGALSRVIKRLRRT